MPCQSCRSLYLTHITFSFYESAMGFYEFVKHLKRHLLNETLSIIGNYVYQTIRHQFGIIRLACVFKYVILVIIAKVSSIN